MATWTQTFSLKSQYTLTLTVNETSTSSANNTSTVSYSLSMSVSDWSGFSDYGAQITIKINEETVYDVYNSSASLNPNSNNSGATWNITSGSKTITHDSNGAKTINCYGSVTVNSGTYSPGSATISQKFDLTSFTQYYLDLNGMLDGASNGGISGYGTADVYINGSLVANDVADYYTKHNSGVKYEIKDIKATTGHTYNGVYSGSLSGTITGTTSVVLSFSTNTYTISYNANGGTSTPSNQTKTYGVTLKLANAISRNSTYPSGYTVTFNGNGGIPSTTSITATNTTWYTFAHWSASNGGNYAAGANYTKNEAATMTAQWNSGTNLGGIATAAVSRDNGATYATITFNGNGGSTPNAITSVAKITYSCTGWYTAASGGSWRANPGGTYTPQKSETLYAQWTSKTDPYGAIILPVPTRPGYKFLGWSTNANATSGVTGTYTPTGDVTLYAIWEVNGLVYIDNGTNFDAYMIFIDNGTSWDQYIPYIDDGTNWHIYS